MAIVTFWSNGKEQTGKTLSMAAIGTQMAVAHSYKILLVSTADDETTLRNCFVPKRKNIIQPSSTFGGLHNGAVDNMQSGMTGLIKMAKANKITPETIRNYTKVVFNNAALEVLFSGNDLQEDISEYYPEIIKQANEFYDFVFVDLDSNIPVPIQRIIINDSNLLIANINQGLASIDRFLEERKHSKILSSFKTLVLIGKYDKFSKYSVKNISRYMGERTPVLSVPYNTLYFEAAEEAGVPDFFINSTKIDKEDRNYLFVQEATRAGDAIIYRLQELLMRM